MKLNKLFPLFSALVCVIVFGLWIQSSHSDTSAESISEKGDGILVDNVDPSEIAKQTITEEIEVTVGVGSDALVITNAIIPKGRWGRHWGRHMTPTFITIHSTQNWSANADAEGHAKLLLSGDKRSVSWHFTVDQDSIYQSVPTNEQARHSDRWGEGDKTSIGIEMCENWGNSRAKTTDRTCRLIAHLMEKHDIPLSNVVPHNHWQITRWDGVKYGKKNCPHFLMDDGEVGEKWHGFLAQVKSHLSPRMIRKMNFDAAIAEQKQSEREVSKLAKEIAELQAEIAKRKIEITKQETAISISKNKLSELNSEQIDNRPPKRAKQLKGTVKATNLPVDSERESAEEVASSTPTSPAIGDGKKPE